MALAAILIGDVPGDDRGVIAVPPGKLFVDGTDLLPIDRGGGAVVVAATDMLPIALGIHPEHLGIFFCQPAGTGTGGSGQDHLAARFTDLFNDRIQIGKIVFSLPGLQGGPGENTYGHFVAVCLLHQLHIPIPILLRPLLRVVVGSVDHMGKAGTGVFLF